MCYYSINQNVLKMTKEELKKLNKENLQKVCTLLTIAFTEEQTKKNLVEMIEGDEKLSLISVDEKGGFYFGEPKEASDEELAVEKALPVEQPKTNDWDSEFEALQKKGFELIQDIKALSLKRRKAGKPNARLDAAVSQVERLIRNNFIK